MFIVNIFIAVSNRFYLILVPNLFHGNNELPHKFLVKYAISLAKWEPSELSITRNPPALVQSIRTAIGVLMSILSWKKVVNKDPHQLALSLRLLLPYLNNVSIVSVAPNSSSDQLCSPAAQSSTDLVSCALPHASDVDRLVQEINPSAQLLITEEVPYLDAGYAFSLASKEETIRSWALHVADNQAIRVYDPHADEQFRSHLSSVNRTKGPVTHRSHIFTDTYVLPPSSLVCEDARRSITIDNAGGQSDISEMYSIDYFTQMYGATNTILEKEVAYWIDYKMVDFISTVDDHRVGVSVARAMGFPSADKFTPEMAARLLYKKLYGLIVARNGVVKDQSFFKSILHIWCQDARVAQLLDNAFSNLDDNDYGLDVKGIVLLQLTVCDDPQLYKNIIR